MKGNLFPCICVPSTKQQSYKYEYSAVLLNPILYKHLLSIDYCILFRQPGQSTTRVSVKYVVDTRTSCGWGID